MIYRSTYNSFLGTIYLECDERFLYGVWLEGQEGQPTLDFKTDEAQPIIIQTKEWLRRYFNKEKPQIKELPLMPKGSSFRQLVWEVLCTIPYGETITYGKISEIVSKKMNVIRMSAQAVGNAVGHNPISIIIPCHRVVGTDGNLTGYAGGLDYKQKLLEHEGVNLQNFYLPKGK